MAGWASGLIRFWRTRGGTDGHRTLVHDEVIRLPRGRGGVLVRVLGGLVVVTREGDPMDHVLRAGAEGWFPGEGLALAWALEASRLELRRCASPGHERRVEATAGARTSWVRTKARRMEGPLLQPVGLPLPSGGPGDREALELLHHREVRPALGIVQDHQP